MGEANVIDRRSVDVPTAHWSVFVASCLILLVNFGGGGFRAIYACSVRDNYFSQIIKMREHSTPDCRLRSSHH